MKRKSNRAKDYTALTLTLLVCLVFSGVAFASEKFVLSATDGTVIILRGYELDDRNQIRTLDSNVILTGSSGIWGTAIAFQKENQTRVFDVYYGFCHDYWTCTPGEVTVSMKRVDSKLQLLFGQDLSIPVAYSLSTARLQKRSGVSLRLLVENLGKIEERRLGENGIPRTAQEIPFPKGSRSPTASEDGKFVAALYGAQIIARSLHPQGPIREIQSRDSPVALALSGPVTRSSQSTGSVPASYRFLFFRVYRDLPDSEGSANLKTRIMRQMIDDSTGEFIGSPKAFTSFKTVPYYYPYHQSVTVSPSANLVFFTEFDASCNRNILRGQVFNPQTQKKVGSSQLLIGCSEFPDRDDSQIDVVQFEH